MSGTTLENSLLAAVAEIKAADKAQSLRAAGLLARLTLVDSEEVKQPQLQSPQLGLDSYRRGEEIAADAKDLKQALEWLKKAAAQGLVEAQYQLGCCYEQGVGFEQGVGVVADPMQAALWWRKAAAQGHPIRSSLEERLELMSLNAIEETRRYQYAAMQGHAWAQFCLGCRYREGIGAEPDDKKAVEWWKKAAMQGYAKAQYLFAVCLSEGRGIKQDKKQALAWYRKAAMQGHAKAQYHVSVCLYNGIGVEKKDAKESFEWCRKAAMQGHAEAQYSLGDALERGDGVTKDAKEAVKWYRKAAMQGHAKAQSNLGVCLFKGEGVIRDVDQALEWWKKAAEQGNAEAQNNLEYTIGPKAQLLLQARQGVAQDAKPTNASTRNSSRASKANALSRELPKIKPGSLEVKAGPDGKGGSTVRGESISSYEGIDSTLASHGGGGAAVAASQQERKMDASSGAESFANPVVNRGPGVASKPGTSSSSANPGPGPGPGSGPSLS